MQTNILRLMKISIRKQVLYPYLRTHRNVDDDLILDMDHEGNYKKREGIMYRQLGIVGFSLFIVGFELQLLGILLQVYGD